MLEHKSCGGQPDSLGEESKISFYLAVGRPSGCQSVSWDRAGFRSCKAQRKTFLWGPTPPPGAQDEWQ